MYKNTQLCEFRHKTDLHSRVSTPKELGHRANCVCTPEFKSPFVYTYEDLRSKKSYVELRIIKKIGKMKCKPNERVNSIVF